MTGERRRRSADRVSLKSGARIRQLPAQRVRNPYAPMELLSADQVEAIHQASMHILENLGIELMSPRALALFEKAGAAVDHSSMNVRIDRENQYARLHPRLPPPDIERSPASRAAVAAMVKQVAASLASPPDEDPKERHRRRIAKTNERFDKDPWFEVGDPEDH